MLPDARVGAASVGTDVWAFACAVPEEGRVGATCGAGAAAAGETAADDVAEGETVGEVDAEAVTVASASDASTAKGWTSGCVVTKGALTVGGDCDGGSESVVEEPVASAMGAALSTGGGTATGGAALLSATALLTGACVVLGVFVSGPVCASSAAGVTRAKLVRTETPNNLCVLSFIR
jgi:hypothetical protein